MSNWRRTLNFRIAERIGTKGLAASKALTKRTNKYTAYEREVLHEASKFYGEQFLPELTRIRGAEELPGFTMREGDRVRLLTLKSWSLHFKLPLSSLLEVLLSFWDRKTKYVTFKVRRILPTRAAALVGPTSLKMLKEHLQRTHSSSELLSAWNEATRKQHLEILAPETKAPSSDDPVVFVSQYTRLIERKRRVRSAVEDKMKRRPYRDNPWL